MSGFDFHLDGFDPVAMSGAKSADQAKAGVRKAEIENQDLKQEVARLYMVTEAMWLMLKQSGNFNDQDLIKHLNEIDERDGKLDGRDGVKAPPPVCSNCNRTALRHRPKCLYCGAPVPQNPFT